MTPADPSPRGLRQLAVACRATAAPVHLCTGRFAPPNTYAVWHLVTPGSNVLQVIWREDGDTLGLRILPGAEGGAC